MQRTETQKQVIYTCNKCGKDYNEANISIEQIDELGLLLFEKNRGPGNGNHLARNYTGRTEVDFCSYECATRYLHEKCDIFVKEVTKKRIAPGSTSLF